MKRDGVERHAVPENRLERFMGMVYSLVEPFGVDDVPEVFHYVELLGQAIERHLVESKFAASPQHRQTSSRRKFIAIFRNRYLSLTDLEYTRAITGIDGRLINQLIKTMEDNNFDVDEFLTWLFDVFLSENQKFCPPSIKFACSSFIIEKFLYDHRDQISKRKEDKMKKKEVVDLIARARVVIRTHGEMKEKIINLLKQYCDGGTMTAERLRTEIEGFERIAREQEAKGDGNVTN